mgnify:CR=1 FL=1
MDIVMVDADAVNLLVNSLKDIPNQRETSHFWMVRFSLSFKILNYLILYISGMRTPCFNFKWN